MVDNPNWQRLPTVQLCAVECGAKCCKAPGHARITREEMHVLKALASTMGKKVKVYNNGPKVWILDHEVNGGQCPFLADDNTCSIHDQRPQACRTYPSRPSEGCLVWPG